MKKWDIKSSYAATGLHFLEPVDPSKDGTVRLLNDGYEPFAVVPHLFHGDLIGEIIWFKEEIE